MSLKKQFGALLLLLASCSSVCRAQSVSPTSAELDLDLRTRIAAVSGSGTRLNTSALRVGTGLAPGLRVETYGTEKYRGYAAQELYVEADRGVNRYQAGLVRLPFGIYNTRETYASGLIDYPMPRGDYAFHSLDWGVPGVSWTGGPTNLQIEAAGFDGKSSGIWDTRNTVRGAAVRLQTYTHDLILGVSRWDGASQPLAYQPQMGAVHMTGLDVRYTRPHLLLRGEFLRGELAGDQETGWYMDAYYHLPGLAKWTLTGRWEQLKPGEDYPMSHQVTVGARYVVSPQWTLVANWRRNNAASSYKSAWTTYAGKGGDVFLQVYRKFTY